MKEKKIAKFWPLYIHSMTINFKDSIFNFKNNSLTFISDREQRELYEAAKIIQKAYRSYKGRQKLEEQDKERAAAICIQNYYRRYKQVSLLWNNTNYVYK